MCSCFPALKTSLAEEFWTFCSLLRSLFGQLDRREYKIVIARRRLHQYGKKLHWYIILVAPVHDDPCVWSPNMSTRCLTTYIPPKKKIWNRVDCKCSEKRSKTHKRLKERFLIRWNRTRHANFWCNHLLSCFVLLKSVLLISCVFWNIHHTCTGVGP